MRISTRIGGSRGGAGDYLADDYSKWANAFTRAGVEVRAGATWVVETHLGGGWRQVWQHQVRWARTIRVSRALRRLSRTSRNQRDAVGGGYAIGRRAPRSGHVQHGDPAGDGFRTRMEQFAQPRRTGPLVAGPRARYLFAFAVWAAGLFGDSQRKSGQRLRLDPDAAGFYAVTQVQKSG